jgi:meso-butanediol dehydrogenase/(S,S)-butanediol dehydrogenase/diacetyl reductase
MGEDRKTVLVTGAAGGIGRATCERLARGSWNVLAVDLNAEKLRWAEGAAHIVPFTADVTSEDDNRKMVAAAEAEFGGLNAAIFNAGVMGGGSIDDLPFEDFQRVISINLFGAVLGIRAALPLLRRQQGSSIVVTSSTMGIAADAGNWAYSASKHALIGLVKSLSRELGWEGIRINALCPGPTQGTGMTGGIETIAPETYELLKRNVPLQRWAHPDEMASVMEFLISPAASYVNGLAMVADGGAVTGSGLLPPKAGDQSAMPAATAMEH